MKIFRDTNQDILLILVSVMCLITPIFLSFYLNILNVYIIFLISVLQVMLLNVHLNTTMHYHIHRPIFINLKLNKIFEYFFSVPAFVGFEEYRYIHTQHHIYSNDRYNNGKIGDPVSTFRFGKNGQEENLWSYIFKTPLRNYFDAKELCFESTDVDWKKIKNQNYIKILFLILLTIINYKFALLYLLIVYVSWLMNAALSYCEHYNVTDWKNKAKNSTSCYNKYYNSLFFNSGYHQEHHFAPGLHWKKLPELKSKLPSDRNITTYTLFHNNPYYKRK